MKIFEGLPKGVEEIIIKHMIASVSVSPEGAIIPLLDTVAIVEIWANMLSEIAQYFDVSLSDEECMKIITASSPSVLGYLGGSKALNWLINLVPGISSLGPMGTNVVSNAYYSYMLGKAMFKLMEENDISNITIWDASQKLVRLFEPMPSIDVLRDVSQILHENFS